MSFDTLLATIAERCRRHAVLVVLAAALLAALACLIASQRLGVETDTDKLFSASLPWRQRAMERDREFPQFRDLLVAVVDAATPEAANATASDLAAALQADPAHFHRVSRPDALPFFQDEGLLFLDTKTLGALLDSTIDAQPFLGQLVADPTARGLFASLSLVAMGVEQGQANLTPYLPALGAFHRAIAGALADHPVPLSWQRLLGGSLADQAGPYRFVLAQPHLDYEALQPGGTSTQIMRRAIAGLEFVKTGQAHVRITGAIALADEEFATVAQGALRGTIGSVVLVIVWLLLAVRSWRLIVPIVLTLALGLALTTGFAAAMVGTLNLVSVAFAILFVGIAVDFSLQFTVRYRESRVLFQNDPERAMAETARRSGGQILVAAAATSAGFLAFVPTAFVGVAQLGLIAGVGMLIAFLCTITFLPAALTLFRPPAERAEIGFRFAAPLDAVMRRRRVPILGVFAILAVLALLLAPRLVFDSDPLDTKDPTTEAMRTLRDLSNSPLTNPYSADVLAPDAESAAAIAERLGKLPLVAQAMSLLSFVPDDQPAKLALIADAASILAPTLSAIDPETAVTPEDLRLAARTALAQIEHASPHLPTDHPLLAIAGDLRTLTQAADPAVLAVNDVLTRFLPEELAALRRALQAKPVTLASLPPALTRDWRLPDGRVRAQALAAPSLHNSQGLRAFVEQVRTVAPDAIGSAVTIAATADTIIGAFRTAAISALVVIAVILMIALRRVLHVILVLLPLLMAALMTLLLAVVLPLPLNFANIIALPLLLGVGVSFNIYFVMNWRAGQPDMLGSATARAVVFSALTTGTAFGSLALSRHPGTASMGELLLLSLGCTLVASVVFVPALLAAMPSPTKR